MTDSIWESYHPFAHIPGVAEICRIVSPTHPAFDCVILLDPQGTHVPPRVWVDTDAGAEYMANRYPETEVHRLPAHSITLAWSPNLERVYAGFETDEGPVRKFELDIEADPTQIPTAIAYGGTGAPVWGSRWTCKGVDWVLEGQAEGILQYADGQEVRWLGEPAIATAASFGELTPL